MRRRRRGPWLPEVVPGVALAVVVLLSGLGETLVLGVALLLPALSLGHLRRLWWGTPG